MATYKLRTCQFGWEIQLFVGTQSEVGQSQVCRSENDALVSGDT